MFLEVVDGSVTSELRRAVLRPQWPVGSRMHGDGEPGVLHIASRPAPDGPVVGACVLLPKPYPVHPELANAWQLRGMATDPDWRGRGVGRGVLNYALFVLNGHDCDVLWCQARKAAVGFYARNGFAAEGEPFDHAETGIEHYHMWRAHPRTFLATRPV